jgi:hypothetical protein
MIAVKRQCFAERLRHGSQHDLTDDLIVVAIVIPRDANAQEAHPTLAIGSVALAEFGFGLRQRFSPPSSRRLTIDECSDHHQCFGYAAFHGARFDRQPVGNFPIGQIVNAVQEKNQARQWRKLVHGSLI